MVWHQKVKCILKVDVQLQQAGQVLGCVATCPAHMHVQPSGTVHNALSRLERCTQCEHLQTRAPSNPSSRFMLPCSKIHTVRWLCEGLFGAHYGAAQVQLQHCGCITDWECKETAHLRKPFFASQNAADCLKQYAFSAQGRIILDAAGRRKGNFSKA